MRPSKHVKVPKPVVCREGESTGRWPQASTDRISIWRWASNQQLFFKAAISGAVVGIQLRSFRRVFPGHPQVSSRHCPQPWFSLSITITNLLQPSFEQPLLLIIGSRFSKVTTVSNSSLMKVIFDWYMVSLLVLSSERNGVFFCAYCHTWLSVLIPWRRKERKTPYLC